MRRRILYSLKIIFTVLRNRQGCYGNLNYLIMSFFYKHSYYSFFVDLRCIIFYINRKIVFLTLNSCLISPISFSSNLPTKILHLFFSSIYNLYNLCLWAAIVFDFLWHIYQNLQFKFSSVHNSGEKGMKYWSR